jgi:hypothetical protein
MHAASLSLVERNRKRMALPEMSVQRKSPLSEPVERGMLRARQRPLVDEHNRDPLAVATDEFMR